MTLCNNLSRKRGVGVFSRVWIFLRVAVFYGTICWAIRKVSIYEFQTLTDHTHVRTLLYYGVLVH